MNISNFQQFLGNVCLIHSSFARNHGGTLEKQKMVQVLKTDKNF